MFEDTSLFFKVMLLLVAAMLSGSFGAWVNRRATVPPNAMFIVSLLGIIVTYVLGHFSAALGVASMVLLTGCIGAMVGSFFEVATELLGWKTICGVFIGTGVVMGICGVIGMTSGINFGVLGPILGVSLFALIVVGVIGWFVRFGHLVRLAVAGSGIIIFAFYFLYDFWRLSQVANNWQNAIDIALNLYLDALNFAMHVIMAYIESQGNHESALHNTMLALSHGGSQILLAASHAAPIAAVAGLA